MTDQPLDQPLHEALAGARAILPLAAGVAVYGLAFGLLAATAGLSGTETGLMGALVLAGASQIVAVERLAAGAGLAAACLAGLALNLRLVLVTASVRDLFAGRPLWQRLLGAHLSTDENFALTLARRAERPETGFWFLVGGGGLLFATWVPASVLGVLSAAALPAPEDYALDFAFTAAFIALARSLWRGRRDLVPWAVAAGIALAVAASGLLVPSWAILAGGLAGALAASGRGDD